MNLDFWKNKNVLITGHTGFKGSWLTLLLNELGSNIYGISDKKKEGIYEIVEFSEILKKEFFVDINILSKKEAQEIFKIANPDIVFHFAAQSLVYEGYKNPLTTIETNVSGTYKILQYTDLESSAKTLMLATTDKVYRFPNSDNTEVAELGGKDFYSASKVGAEFVIEAYQGIKKRDELNLSVIRSGNVIGGGDRAEYRLIKELIDSINSGKTFELRKPNSIRPWQFILDSLWGYLLAAQDNFTNNTNEVFNLNSELNNEFTAEKIVKIFLNNWEGKVPEMIITKEIYKEEDILKINSTKARKLLNWKPIYDVETTIEKIIEWEKSFKIEKNTDLSISQIQKYLKDRS